MMIASSSLWDMVLLVWPELLTLVTLIIDVSATCHVILHKRDTRSAIAWVGLIWLAPFFGALFYVWLGINRIQRRAKAMRPRRALPPEATADQPCLAETPGEGFPIDDSGVVSLAHLIGRVTGRALQPGNRVTVLNGETSCYPTMLEAIEQAKASVSLTTYIFDNDRAGQAFLAALVRAMSRGVEVRVIIDDVGTRYSFPTIIGPMRRAGVPVARFLPKIMPWAFPYANLRNHRKIMVVDGRVGFTGGMNIREGHWHAINPSQRIEDMHFKIEGPVVSQMQEVFAEDWGFSTQETLDGEKWFPDIDSAGPVFARGISDGPDADFEKLRLTLLGAIACAQSSIRIVTPYFLPDSALITALNIAALRGVEVDILLPRNNNLRLVQWASMSMLWQVLERGCRIWQSTPHFDHTKLMVIDGVWTLIGSTNWDPRSLRLNFEFNLECYDRKLAASLEALIERKIQNASRLTLEDAEQRSLPIKLRDGVARLLSPYL